MCIMLHIMRNTPNHTHAQELVTLRTGKPVEIALRELYVEQGLSQVAIADQLGITRLTVAMWLRQFGISRDDRPAVAL